MKRLYLLLLAPLLLASAVNGQTLYDYYGGHLPSISDRAIIATQIGINNYYGSTQQNNKLSNYLYSKSLVAQPLIGSSGGSPNTGGYNPVTGYLSHTTSFVAANATTIPVVSTKDPSGNQIDLSLISSAPTVKVYMNLEAGLAKQESIVCTGLTATSWTGCTRGLAYQGSSETASSTATSHNAGASIIITNIGQFYNQFVAIDGTQTINGVKTFAALPQSTGQTPTGTNQFVTLGYLASVTSTGGINASTVVKGVVQEATDAMLQSSSTTGSSGARTYANGGSFAQTSTANKVPVSNGQGVLDPNWINTSSPYKWGGTQTFATIVVSTSTIATSTISNAIIASTTIGSENVTTSSITSLTIINKSASNLSSLIYATTTPVSVASSNSNFPLVSSTLPGNVLQKGNVVHIHLNLSQFNVGSNHLITLKFLYGGMIMTTNTLNAPNVDNIATQGSIDAYLYGAGATNAQAGTMNVHTFSGGIFTGNAGTNGVYAINYSTASTTAVDSTVNNSLAITAQFGTSEAASAITVDNAYIEALQ